MPKFEDALKPEELYAFVRQKGLLGVIVYKSVWCDLSDLIVGYDFEQ